MFKVVATNIRGTAYVAVVHRGNIRFELATEAKPHDFGTRENAGRFAKDTTARMPGYTITVEG